jgi:hypothetical protein
MYTSASNTASNPVSNPVSNPILKNSNSLKGAPNTVQPNDGTGAPNTVQPNDVSGNLSKKTIMSRYDDYLMDKNYQPELTIQYQGESYECFVAYRKKELKYLLVCFKHQSIIKMKEKKIKVINPFYYNHLIPNRMFTQLNNIYTLYVSIPKDNLYKHEKGHTIVLGDSIFKPEEEEKFNYDQMTDDISFAYYYTKEKIVFQAYVKLYKKLYEEIKDKIFEDELNEELNEELNRMKEVYNLNETDIIDLWNSMKKTEQEEEKNKKKEEEKKIYNSKKLIGKMYSNSKNLFGKMSKRSTNFYSKLTSKPIEKPTEVEFKINEFILYKLYTLKESGLLNCIIHSLLIGQVHYKYENLFVSTEYDQYFYPSKDFFSLYIQFLNRQKENRSTKTSDPLKRSTDKPIMPGVGTMFALMGGSKKKSKRLHYRKNHRITKHHARKSKK